ncbi:hypothetical protein QKW35_01405 [Pontibacterium granulatum]|uniref:hypothetical protein n=1 Tax=Pontibacterium granulatum TaxID=2036029 RepID=UPI00249B48FB|nr:hypothetical protein [Pontibacterium granulatum]MDI3323019.1 hypothetical protein [Pontibacterium granulatum]
MSTNNRPAIFSARSLSLFAAVVFLGCLLLGGGYLWFASNQQAEAETRGLGHSLAKQTTFLIRPLILADDRISTNYLLQELAELEHVTGLQLTDAQDQVIARAGENEGISIQRQMVQQERRIGTLTLWLAPKPLQQVMQRQLLLALLIALISASLTAIVLWYRCRAADDAMSLAQGEVSEDTPVDEPEEERQATENRDLVELLRPEPAQPTPQLAPTHSTEAEEAPADADEYAETDTEVDTTAIELEEQPLTQKAQQPVAKENPLRRRGRDEEQLTLYSFEHEMELMLTAEDAAYLLYIDATSAHAEYADASERDELLAIYTQLAAQVAHIYSGQLEILKNGDLQINFTVPVEKDAHGINALCAGLLFVLLYKGFNKQRIGQFQPVMNLHIALVRGHKGKPAILQEESRFLTRTTQSNELISHTALTEAPDIKRALLKDADIRREDEDKVLIHKVEKRYQTLFEKQCNHLLTKLKQQAESTH